MSRCLARESSEGLVLGVPPVEKASFRWSLALLMVEVVVSSKPPNVERFRRLSLRCKRFAAAAACPGEGTLISEESDWGAFWVGGPSRVRRC